MAAINSPVLIPNLTVGNRVFTDLAPSSLIILHGPSEAAVNSGRTTLRKANGSAGYPVTAGKTLVILAIRLVSTAGVFSPFPAQTDNDVGIAGNTAFSNPVYFAGLSPSSDPLWFATQNGTGQVLEMAVYWTITANRYVSFDSNSSTTAGSMQVFGYEI